MPEFSPRRPVGLLTLPHPADRWGTLSDTPAHAAATALVVARSRCLDPVRARSATSLFPIAADVENRGGDCARRRSGVVVALVESASAADPECRPLLLALERWLLHPGRDTAGELTSAAADFAMAAPEKLLQNCWSVGAGLDAAVDAITRLGIGGAGGGALAAVAEACGCGVSYVWAARRCGVSRESLQRRVRERLRVPTTAKTR